MFNKIFRETLDHEGGYVFDPADRGGETYKGIARKFWPDWEGWTIIDERKSSVAFPENLDASVDLQRMVKEFYKKHFWDSFNGDLIPSYLLCKELFDTGVNQGIGTAVKYLQRALNALNNNQKHYKNIAVDGGCGPVTIKTILNCLNVRDEKLIYKLMNILQGAFYIDLMEKNESQERFVGWFNRVDFK
jgi:lysozyme family protein